MVTFLLIHGGMQGGWCWEKLTPYIADENHAVIAPCLSGLGTKAHLNAPTINLSIHIHDIVSLITRASLKQVILVGHSYGGMVATGVATKIPYAIDKIIYLDAVLAKPGESMSTAIFQAVWDYLQHKANNEGDGWQVPAMSWQDYGFTSDENITFVKGKSTPHSIACFTECLDYDPRIYQKIPAYYIFCQKSLFLSNMQDRARDMGISFQEIPSAHFPMIEVPKLLASIFKSLSREKIQKKNG